MFLDSGKCFGFWEVFRILGRVFGFWEVFRILGRVFEFWEVFWILGSVFGFWEVFCPYEPPYFCVIFLSSILLSILITKLQLE